MAPVAPARRAPLGTTGEVRPVAAADRSALLAWLDDGLRGARRGRLLAEYPTSLAEPGAVTHFAVRTPRGFAAHALARQVEVRAGAHRLPLGMIGLVYTDPAHRGRGLASRCVAACVRALAARGVPWAALWSDRHAFYRRLGFEPAGRETLYRVTRRSCELARRRLPGRYATGAPCPDDWSALEALYAAKPARARRPAGDLARLAAAPDTRVAVARSGPRVAGYAALGRGDDFEGVVHEWAGEPAAVVACLEALLGDREAIGWLCGPIEEPPAASLRLAGALPTPGCFALLRVLAPERLWSTLARGVPALAGARLRHRGAGAVFELDGSHTPLGHGEVLQLLLGAAPPAPVRERHGALWRAARAAGALPCPLFVWGFDSI